MKAIVLLSLLAVVLAQNCVLIVPPNPLTATGLATPYILLPPCTMADATTFVQGAVIDTDTGAAFVYNPLVVDQGKAAAVNPTKPNLPKNFVVGLWFGTNGDATILQDNGGSLAAGKCVNGLGNSIFGQFAHCNAPAFFAAANSAIQKGQLVPPPLGTALDGLPCLTTRDFSLIDQDQSDNVNTEYIITQTGKTAQNTAANRAALGKNGMVIGNGSDNRLLSLLDAPLGCTTWNWPNLADKMALVPSLPANELHAAAVQAKPVATVPCGDPMALVDGKLSLKKTNLYRLAVNQNTVNSCTGTAADTFKYCMRFGRIFPSRFFTSAYRNLLINVASPDPAFPNIYVFLADRFMNAFGADNLNCTGILGVPIMLSVTKNDSGYPINAEVDVADILPVLPEDIAVATTAAVNGTNAGFSLRPQVGFSVLSFAIGVFAALW